MPDIDVDFVRIDVKMPSSMFEINTGPALSPDYHLWQDAARAAIKDIARALGVEFQASNELAGFVPEKPGTKLQEALDLPIVQNYMQTNPLHNVYSLSQNQ